MGKSERKKAPLTNGRSLALERLLSGCPTSGVTFSSPITPFRLGLRNPLEPSLCGDVDPVLRTPLRSVPVRPLVLESVGWKKDHPEGRPLFTYFLLALFRIEPCLSRLPLGGAKGPDGVTKRKGG